MSGPELESLSLADPPELWTALGFEVAGSTAYLGGVELRLGAVGRGISGWAVRGVDSGAEIDGLRWSEPRGAQAGAKAAHPNGAIGIDHVVVLTPDFDRTTAALEQAGVGLRRVRDAGGFRQGFRRIGPAILELVETREAPSGPARFWGLVVIVEDLEALARRLGDKLGRIKPAVQPGRRIVTLGASAGLGQAVAFMDPE